MAGLNAPRQTLPRPSGPSGRGWLCGAGTCPSIATRRGAWEHWQDRVRAGLARRRADDPPSALASHREFLARSPSPGIARQRRIFCNRNLRMSGHRVGRLRHGLHAGHLRPAEMDELSIRATIEKLVARGYPEFVRTIPYATTSRCAGLLIDKRFGHILKMNRYKFVTKGYHGFRELAKDELRALYHSKKIRPATPRYHWIDTLYALSEAALYAALVEAIEQRGLAIDYAQAFTDIRESIDEAHRDGTILERSPADFPRFVDQGPRARADAAQAAERGQEALRPDELALVVHRQDDDLPPRRRDGRVPALAELLRHRHRRRDQARVLPGAPAAHGARRRDGSSRRLSRSSAARSTKGATSTTSSARSAPRATRSSTSGTTSTATSSAARRRARGAPR